MMKTARRKQRAFTLIEMMITVAVAAILAAVALPAYTSYAARGKITEGVTTLADYRVKMEQYFQDNRNYGAAAGSCPVTVTSNKYFTYSCSVGSATPTAAYTALAQSVAGALGAQTGDYTYSITEVNAKATTKFKGATVSKTCWLVRGSEC